MNFDEYVERYDAVMDRALPLASLKQDAFLRVKADKLRALTVRHGLRCGESRLLEVGCGVGLMSRLVADDYGSIDGIDISESSIEVARAAIPRGSFRVYPGGPLPYAAGAFDVTFAVCVVHHVPPAEWEPFLAELVRVNRPGGLVAIFEHNPLNPLTRIVVSRCEFDADAVLLGARRVRRMFAAVGVPRTRQEHFLITPWRDPLSRWVERAARALPLGAQYVVHTLPEAAPR